MALDKVLAEKGDGGGLPILGTLGTAAVAISQLRGRGQVQGAFPFPPQGSRHCSEGILAVRSCGLGGAEGPHPHLLLLPQARSCG